MKRLAPLFMFGLLAVHHLAYAYDDLVHCRWENGGVMSESTCTDQRKHNYQNQLDAGLITQDQVDEFKRPKPPKGRALTKPEKAFVMAAVNRQLKDPDSSRFKWLKIAELVNNNFTDSVYYCGLVNSKNSYGGYVGYEPFLALISWKKGKLEKIYSIEFGDKNFPTVIKAVCADNGYELSNAD